eukprot:g17580.t1
MGNIAGIAVDGFIQLFAAAQQCKPLTVSAEVLATELNRMPDEIQGPAGVRARFFKLTTRAHRAAMKKLYDNQFRQIQEAANVEQLYKTIAKPILFGTLLAKASVVKEAGKVRMVFAETLPERHLDRIAGREVQFKQLQTDAGKMAVACGGMPGISLLTTEMRRKDQAQFLQKKMDQAAGGGGVRAREDDWFIFKLSADLQMMFDTMTPRLSLITYREGTNSAMLVGSTILLPFLLATRMFLNNCYSGQSSTVEMKPEADLETAAENYKEDISQLIEILQLDEYSMMDVERRALHDGRLRLMWEAIASQLQRYIATAELFLALKKCEIIAIASAAPASLSSEEERIVAEFSQLFGRQVAFKKQMKLFGYSICRRPEEEQATFLAQIRKGIFLSEAILAQTLKKMAARPLAPADIVRIHEWLTTAKVRHLMAAWMVKQGPRGDEALQEVIQKITISRLRAFGISTSSAETAKNIFSTSTLPPLRSTIRKAALKWMAAIGRAEVPVMQDYACFGLQTTEAEARRAVLTSAAVPIPEYATEHNKFAAVQTADEEAEWSIYPALPHREGTSTKEMEAEVGFYAPHLWEYTKQGTKKAETCLRIEGDAPGSEGADEEEEEWVEELREFLADAENPRQRRLLKEELKQILEKSTDKCACALKFPADPPPSLPHREGTSTKEMEAEVGFYAPHLWEYTKQGTKKAETCLRIEGDAPGSEGADEEEEEWVEELREFLADAENPRQRRLLKEELKQILEKSTDKCELPADPALLTLGHNKQKVGPVLKHYINNDKELDRTLRKGKLAVPWEAQMDIYLKPFVAGSNVGAAAAMCGYNWLVDPEGGEPVSMCFNKRLKWLTEQSKRTWVLTDYPAAEQVGYPTKYLSADPPYNVTPDNTSMATAGHSWVSWGNKWADWHFPLEYEKRNAGTQLKESVGIAEEDGGHQVMANQIDKADRELKNAYVAGFVGWGKALGIHGIILRTDDHYTDGEHETWYSELDEANKQKFYSWTSRTIAESFVLLKNEGNLLPLNEKETVFIDSSCKNHAEFNLTAQGSGEASVHLRQTTAATAFSKKIGNKEQAKVHLSCSFRIAGENADRGSISLPKPTMGDKAKTCVFVSTPGSIELSWAHEAPCIVLGIAPSVFGFNGLSYLFYGKVNPGGHTIMSVVTNAADLEFGDGDSKRETGYMMLQVRGKTPAFEFGWGLPFGATSWDEVAEIVPKQHDRTIRRIAFCFKGKLAPHPGVPPPNPTAQLWYQVEGRKWRQLLTFVKHRGLEKGAEECYASYYDPVTEWDDGENGKYVPKPFKLFYGLNGYGTAKEWPKELESGRDEVKPFQRAKYPEHVWARHLSNQRETGNNENVGRVFTGKGKTGDAVIGFWEGQKNPEAAHEDKLCPAEAPEATPAPTFHCREVEGEAAATNSCQISLSFSHYLILNVAVMGGPGGNKCLSGTRLLLPILETAPDPFAPGRLQSALTQSPPHTSMYSKKASEKFDYPTAVFSRGVVNALAGDVVVTVFVMVMVTMFLKAMRESR